MAGYCTIRGDVLDYDRRVEGLSDPAYRLFMLTLYSRGRTMLGVMRFVAADALPRVRGWGEAQAQAALEELQAVGLVAYDEQARLLFNPLALEFAPIRGLNQVRGAAATLREFPDSPVLLPALEHLLAAGEAENKGKAKDASRDLPELLAELRARRAALAGQESKPLPTPLPPPAKGVDSPSIPPGDGLDTPLAPPTQGLGSPYLPPGDGVDRGLPGGMAGQTTHCGREGLPPTYGMHTNPLGRGCEGGPKGVARGCEGGSEGGSNFSPRAHARPDPDPEDQDQDPPKAPPPSRASPANPGRDLTGQGRERGAEGESQYAHLDPRNRSTG